MSEYMSVCQERECLNAQTEFCMFYVIANIINESLGFVYEFLQSFKTLKIFLVFSVICNLATCLYLFLFTFCYAACRK